ncbi:MAG: isoleucine--tRNA ligase [Oligoflexales bacterium]|nr:isoleucine--tRNA ligase [Oligoflexales bacterium]
MKVAESGIKFPRMETEILKNWEENNTFKRSVEMRRGARQFSFYDGPPFANGLPHYGHLLANTIKDTVPRYWSMKGYFVERRFGWDCHGLPVEYEIEKREGLKGRSDIIDLGVAKFNELCRSSVFHYVSEWKKIITRIGRWVDWDNQYRTMDRSFMESVWWVFSELYNKGLVYRGHKIVPYSPRITAVLSNFEANQNYKDVQDPAITVKFKLVDEEAYFLAWTTTPWTLISNLALTIGPNIKYAKVREKESGIFYYLAESRINAVFKPLSKGQRESVEIVEIVDSEKLLGRRYEPLFPYFKDQRNAFRVISADYVTTDEGTGIVHTAPAYGEEDFLSCIKAEIDLVDPLDEEARFTDLVPEYRGMFVKDADKAIIKDLKESGKLLKHETVVHSYPYCDRTDSPLIYRAIPAWYVAVEQFRDLLVENNEKINWVPDNLKDGRMGNWLRNARDWAISRNRFWGTPIPIWICSKNENHRVCIGSVGELEKRTNRKVDDIHKHFIDDLSFECQECKGTMKRISEVFDCWFESGAMPYSQLHYPFENQEEFHKSFPANFIAEGLDQTRGWFYTLCVLSGALFKKPAFQNVVVNGLILASDGRKMSKRWRNYTPPEELIETYGADSVRLYMLNSSVLKGGDLRFSNEGVKETTRAVLLPLWNSYSFLSTYAAADEWKPELSLVNGSAPSVECEMDQWIISRFQTLISKVHAQMESYKLFYVVPEVLGFIEDLTNWYIRLNRRRFWSGSKTLSKDTEDAYRTLFYILVGFAKVFAPFAPFISERIYKDLTEGIDGVMESVHLCDMPNADGSLINESLEKKMSMIRSVTELGRSLRSKHQIKTRQALSNMLVITRNPEDRKYIEGARNIIQSELNVKEIEFSTEESKYVSLSIKPNLRTLGKRLGKDLKSFKDHLEELSKSQEETFGVLAKLEKNGSVKLMDYDFTEEDFLIERGPRDERLIATEKGITILLDTTLTEELINEGVARELINRIQKLRKDSDLLVSDRIILEIHPDEKITQVVSDHREYISEEVLATDIIIVKSKEHFRVSTKIDHCDVNGFNVSIGLSVAKN